LKVLETAKQQLNEANELLKEVKELSSKAVSERASSQKSKGNFQIMRKAPSSWRRDGSEEPARTNGS